MSSKVLSIVLSVKNRLQAGLTAAKTQLMNAGTAIGNAFKHVTAGIAAVGAAIAAAMKRAEDFQKSIAKLTTVSNFTAEDATAAAMRISAAFGIAKKEVVEGLHGALSEGVDAQDAEGFVTVAAKMARATGDSLTDTVKALTIATNAYGLAGEDAADVADTLYAAHTIAGASSQELAAALETVAPTAAVAGVSLSDLIATLSTMHAAAIPIPKAAVQLQGAIRGMSASFGDGWTATMTLQNGLQAVADKAGGSSAAIKAAMGRWGAAEAVLTTTGRYAAIAAANLEAVGASTGKLDADYKALAGDNVLSRLAQGADNLAISAGKVSLAALGPMLEKATSKLSEFGDGISKFLAGDGMVQARQFAEFFTERLKYAAQTGIARFQLMGTAISDTFAWLTGVVAAHVAIWIARCKYAADYASAVWAKIKSPSSEFQSPSNAGIEMAKADAAALHARSWEEIYADTLEKQSQIAAKTEAFEARMVDLERKGAEELLANRARQEEERAGAETKARAARLAQLKEANEAARAERAKEAEAEAAELAQLNERKAYLEGEGLATAEAELKAHAERRKALEAEMTAATEAAEKARQGLHATARDRANARKEARQQRVREQYEQRMRELLDNPRFLNGTMKMSNKLAEYAAALKAQQAAAANLAKAQNQEAQSLAALERIGDETKVVGAKIDKLNAALVGG